MKVDIVASGLIDIYNCFHRLAYCFFFKQQLNQKQITVEFQSNSFFPSDVSEHWIASIALNWILEMGIICSSQKNFTIQGLYTYLWGVHLCIFFASKLLYKSCMRIFSGLLIYYPCSPNVPKLCNSMGWGEEKSLQWVNSDINIYFFLQRMHSFYSIWPVFSVCTVSLFCKLNTRNTNYGFGFHLKPHNGRNVVFGSRCSSDSISYSP